MSTALSSGVTIGWAVKEILPKPSASLPAPR